MKSYDVKFWAIRPGKSKTRRTYEVRWKVGPKSHSRTLRTKAQAESFLSDLRHAARAGQAFDTEAGLPDSLMPAPQARSWLNSCLAYVDMKWPTAAPKTRDSLTDALAAIVPAVVRGRATRVAGDDRAAWGTPALRSGPDLVQHYQAPRGRLGVAMAGDELSTSE